jgi:hypothetical protein
MSAQVQQSTFPLPSLDDDWIARNQNSIDPLSYATVPLPADGFSSAYPSATAGVAPLQQGGFMSQIMQLLRNLVSMLQQFTGGLSGFAFDGPQPNFTNATIASTGDPHLSIDGTLGNGSGVSLRYDDMHSDPSLVRSDSFFGGYEVSTQTTQPDQNGVTYNRCATVTTDFGRNQVTFDKDGDATILRNGNAVAITAGQTVDLGGGETVTDEGNSLVVNDTNRYGASITTTMTRNGNGVDVKVDARNADLGGDVVRKALGRAAI